MAATARGRAATGAKGQPKRAARPRAAGVRPRPTETSGTPEPVAAQQPLMRALRAEHRHMTTVMRLFEEQLRAIGAGEFVDTHVLYEIMHYMVTWPDRFHHPREDLVYARVAELDPRAADEVDTLQRDHDATARHGRKLLEDIEGWRAGEVSGQQLIANGRGYIEHIDEHMSLEEKLVFPHIEQTLSARDWAELGVDDRLSEVAAPVFGPKVQREFRNMTRKLRRGIRRGVERGAMVEWVDVEAFMESVEVFAMAYEAARDVAGEHLRGALQQSGELLLERPLLAPWRITANNARHTVGFLGEMLSISRDTLDDLVRVNRARQDRLRLLERDARRR